MLNENILLNYLHTIDYTITADNIIGADEATDVTSADKSVAKHGNNFNLLYPDVTNAVIFTPRSDGGGINKWWYEIYNENNTLMGTIKDENNTSTYVAGSTETSALLIIKIVQKSGTVSITDGDTITSFTTPTGDAPATIYLSGESFSSGSLFLYISRAGSSYYDTTLIHGGEEHVPDGSDFLPYFTIQNAYDNLGAGTIVYFNEGVSGEVFNERLVLDTASKLIKGESNLCTLQFKLGASIYRDPQDRYNNSTAVFFNENGSDANNGTWQSPFLTIAFSITNRGGKHVVYGGTGATATSGVFDESITLNAAFNLDAEYGYTPTIRKTTTVAEVIDITHAGANIYGFIIDGNGVVNAGIKIGVAYSGNIQFNTIQNNVAIGILIDDIDYTGDISKNIIQNNSDSGIKADLGDTSAGTIDENIINNNGNTVGDWGIDIDLPTGAATVTTEFKNNLLFSNQNGIRLDVVTPQTFNGKIENNTIFNSTTTGLDANAQGALLSTAIRNNIVWNSGTNDLVGTNSPDISYTAYETTDGGFVLGTGMTTSEVNFIKETVSFKLGISGGASAVSSAYKTDVNTDDMGTHLRLIEIQANSNTISGLILNGQNELNNAFWQSATRTSTTIENNNIINFQGIAIDNYGTGNTNSTIQNNKIFDNGDGVKLTFGGNTFQENLVYNNFFIGLHIDQSNQTINHNVFFNQQYGIRAESSTNGILIKNNIFSLNTLWSINTDVGIPKASYINNCNPDAIDSDVDTSDLSNKTSLPLLVSSIPGSEDFHIKTIEGGFLSNSPCKDAADDNKDIGAYLSTRTVTDDSWESYQLEFNPNAVDFPIPAKGLSRFDNAQGSQWLYAKDKKRQFTLKWTGDQYSTQGLRNQIEFLSSLFQNLLITYTDEQVTIRMNPLPTELIDSGTSASISTAKTLTDSNQIWVRNEHKGWHVAIQSETGTGNGNLNAAAKTLTVSGKSWTTNEWTGFSFFRINNYYFIKSNTATVLTLSDPNGTLVTANSIDWNIEKYFKINSNTATVLNLDDDDSELTTDTLDYVIRFIECRAVSPNFRSRQDRYFWQKEYRKGNYQIVLEEI